MPAATRPLPTTTSAATTGGSRRRSFFFQAEDGIRDLYVTGVQTWLFRSRRAPAEISGLFRARADARKRRMAARQGIHVRGPVAVPDDRGPALCLSSRDAKAGGESPAASRASRPRRLAAAHRRLPRVEAADSLQPARYLQELSGTGRLA